MHHRERARPRADQPLPYDAVWEGFGVHCISHTSGLTCVNGDGGGFFLSRERWQLF